MDLILLAGGNPEHNLDWIKEVKENIQFLFDKSRILYYNHWKKKEKTGINIDLELNELVKVSKKSEDYAIFAKSTGVVIALKGIYEKLISPETCFFVGLPLRWADKLKIDVRPWLKDYSIQTLFVQQEEDRQSSYKGLVNLLEDNMVQNHFPFKVPGEDHKYQDIDQLRRLVECYLKHIE